MTKTCHGSGFATRRGTIVYMWESFSGQTLARPYRRGLPYIGAFLCAIALALSPAAVVADSVNSMQSFDGAKGWLNSKPLAPSDLTGKVVLVDVWEYTCINCLRTLPYLKTWYAR